MTMRRRQLTLLALGGAATLLRACVTRLHSTALTAERLQAGICLQRSLPDRLPSGTQVLAQAQLVRVPTGSAAGLRLFFGVHRLRKDQLHPFRRRSATS